MGTHHGDGTAPCCVAIAVNNGRTIEAAIIVVFSVPSIAILVVYVVAWRRGKLDEYDS